jgi:hypothetical protein
VEFYGGTYLMFRECLPLFYENPDEYEPKEVSDVEFYTARSLFILGDIFMLLYNTNYFMTGKDLSGIAMNIWLMV